MNTYKNAICDEEIAYEIFWDNSHTNHPVAVLMALRF